jgi:hypothetical protein
MWGFNNKLNRTLANSIFNIIVDPKIAKSYNSNMKSPKGADQYFLNDYVYSLVINDLISHDSYFCKGYEKGRPFPNKRIGNCFVGDIYACNTNATYHECPIECRPSDHKDWKYC